KLNGDGTKFGITTDAGKVTAFRGYIDAPAASVKSLSFSLEGATVGIDSTPAAAHESLPAYDLSGRQLAPAKENGALTLQRGQTYIINGKKMIVR
ncbi:MAG: hypothetical protein MJZ43_04705, partial [Bacteroidaceae bacterium]|nr:hypothetical protein [Bacteroidaceae bacterium]